MSENPVHLGAQFRSDAPDAAEQESVRTTIVGGRPPGSGKPLGPLPRGIEILLKKASVDAEFKNRLLDDPESAARSIELNLDPIEQAMLRHIPREQLVAVIGQTVVPEPQRRVFLGQAASLMIAVLGGITLAGCGEQLTKGSRPAEAEEEPAEIHRHPVSAGINPDYPASAAPETD